MTQPLLQILDPDPSAGLELHLQYRFLWTGTPEVDGIDGIIGRLRSDETEADFDIIRADLALDRIECLQRDLLGALDVRSRRGPQVQLELPGDNFPATRRSDRRPPICVEPISKSFEEHNEAGKLDKAEEIVGHGGRAIAGRFQQAHGTRLTDIARPDFRMR